jgi:hypothetical protein
LTAAFSIGDRNDFKISRSKAKV